MNCYSSHHATVTLLNFSLISHAAIHTMSVSHFGFVDSFPCSLAFFPIISPFLSSSLPHTYYLMRPWAKQGEEVSLVTQAWRALARSWLPNSPQGSRWSFNSLRGLKHKCTQTQPGKMITHMHTQELPETEVTGRLKKERRQ